MSLSFLKKVLNLNNFPNFCHGIEIILMQLIIKYKFYVISALISKSKQSFDYENIVIDNYTVASNSTVPSGGPLLKHEEIDTKVRIQPDFSGMKKLSLWCRPGPGKGVGKARILAEERWKFKSYCSKRSDKA